MCFRSPEAICLQIPFLLLTTMATIRSTKRKRPMIVGEADAAQVVRPRTIYETKKDGSVVNKTIWEPLYTPLPNAPDIPAVEQRMDSPPPLFFEPGDKPSPQPEFSRSKSVRKYI